MALRLASAAGVLLADVTVPAMLDRPELAYISDIDGALSVATPPEILPALVDRNLLVACGHYPGSGIGRVVSRGDTIVWEVRARQPMGRAPCRAEGSTTLAGCPGRGTTRSSIASGR